MLAESLRRSNRVIVFSLIMMLAGALFTVGMAGKANALVDGAPAPTVSSDKADYAPGETVNLAGSNWQPGESVHLNVNDEAGKTWSRDVDVTADDSGSIKDQFQLPDWFVATYKVTATGARSGVVTTSFTDAAVTLQGQSNPGCTTGSQCDEGYQNGNLTGWKELDQVPFRLKFSSTGTYTVNVSFDHVLTSDNTKPGIQDLYNWTAGSGVSLTNAPTLTDSSGAVWAYTLTAKVTSANSAVAFKGNLSAGAHNFTGNSLAVGADNGGGNVQIVKPAAAPGSPDLAVTKTGPSNATPGSTIQYTLNYQNKSATSAATGAQLTDFLPGGVSYVSGSCSGTCSVAGNEVTWNLGNVAPGASGSRTLQVSIPANATYGTAYTDQARILSAENDAALGDNTASFTTTVSFNRNPNANNDSLTTNEDNAGNVNVLSNDTDQDNDTLTVTGKTNGAHGTVSCTSAGVCTYTPNANYNGSDSFTYTVSDGHGGTATGTVNVTVNPVNDAPSFTKGANQTVNEDAGAQSVSGWATNISPGPSDESGQALNFIVTNNTNNALFTSSGQPSISSNGTLTYTPAQDANGTATVSVKLHDDGGTANGGVDDSSVQTFTITVNPVNDPPVISSVAADGASVDEGSPATITVTANDPDNLSADLRYSFDCDNDGTFEKGPQAANNATCTYPDNGTYPVKVKVTDGAGGSDMGSTNVVVNNVAPKADFNAPNSVDEGQDVNLSLTNVVDPGTADTHTYRFKCGDADWTDYGTSNTHSCSTSDDGSLVVKGQVKDDDGGESPEYSNTVTINNVGPTAKSLTGQDGQVTTPEDTPKDITLEAATNPGNDNLTFSKVDGEGPSHGSLSGSGANVTYTPDADYNGPDSFKFQVCDDDQPQQCDTGTVDIQVTPVNDAPNANDDTKSTHEDTVVAIDVKQNDSPGPANESAQSLTVHSVTNPDHGTAEIVTSGADTGKVLYTPDANYNGDDSFTYTVCDDGDPSKCATAKVNVTVNPVNDDPVARNDSYSTDEDTPLTVNADNGVLKNDSDADGDNLTATLKNNASHGTVTMNSDGSFTYTPDADYNGDDSFTYTLSDGNGGSADATVTVHIQAVNDGPVAKDLTGDNDKVTTPEDTPKDITLTATDTDSTNLTFSKVNGEEPSHGSVSINQDGTSTYTPDANYNGPDSFKFQVCDDATPDPLCDTGTVDIAVTPVNDPPVGTSDIRKTPEDTPLVISSDSLTANDSTGADNENQTLSVTEVSEPENGTVELSGDQITFTPDANYNGPASFKYTVCDNGDPQKCSTEKVTVNVTVSEVNDPPVANTDNISVDEGGDKTFDPTSNDSKGPANEDNQTLSVDSIITQPEHGTATLINDGADAGKVKYAATGDYNGDDSFTYKVCDDGTTDGAADSKCDTGTVNVTVNPVNDKPVAKPDNKTTPENTPLVISSDSLTANDDPGAANESGQTLTVSEVSNGVHGNVSLNPDTHEITFTPDQNYNGSASFDYKVCDNGDPQECSTETAIVNVVVTPVNSRPEASDHTYSMNEDDSALSIDFSQLVSDVETPNADLTYDIGSVDSSEGTLTGTGATRDFTPANNFNGQVQISYTVTDRGDPDNCGTVAEGCAASKTSEQKTVTINVNPVNDNPTISEIGNQSILEDHATDKLAFKVGDVDGDSGEITTASLSGLNITATSNNHALVPDSNITLFGSGTDRQVQVTSAPNANSAADGGSAKITLTVSDNNEGSASVSFMVWVKPVNDKPGFTRGNDIVLPEDSARQTVKQWANNLVMGPSNESGQAVKDFTVTGITTTGQSAASPALFSELPHMDNDGNLMFKTNPNANGIAKFSVIMHDDGGVRDGGVDASDEQDFAIQVDNDNSDLPNIKFNVAGPQTVYEGALRTYGYTIDNTNADDLLLDINESCGKAGRFIDDGHPGNNSFKCFFPDGPAASTVSVGAKIRTQTGTSSAVTATPSDSVKVNVKNVAPRVTMSGPVKALKGHTKLFKFSFKDPGKDTASFVAGSPNCGDGNKLVSKKMFGKSGSFECKFQVAPKKTIVSLKLKDSDSAMSNEASSAVAVRAPEKKPSGSCSDIPNPGGTTGDTSGGDPSHTGGTKGDCGGKGSVN